MERIRDDMMRLERRPNGKRQRMLGKAEDSWELVASLLFVIELAFGGKGVP